MKQLAIDSMQTFRMESIHLCDAIAIRELPIDAIYRTKNEATVALGAGGYAFLFSFGSAVFFNVSKDQQVEFLRRLRDVIPAARQAAEQPVLLESTRDDIIVAYHPEARQKVLFDRVVVNDLDETRLRLVAMVLAQSTALDIRERRVEQLVEQSAHMNEAMKLGGRVPGNEKDLIRFIGEALSARQSMLSSLAVLDSPEVTWDDPALDRLFRELRSNFEMEMRVSTVEKKLNLVVESAEILVDLTKSRREIALEIIVIVLIALEVLVPFLLIHH
ncbi:MAG: RMD1 family protein [Candidatus Xenobia bacterium]